MNPVSHMFCLKDGPYSPNLPTDVPPRICLGAIACRVKALAYHILRGIRSIIASLLSREQPQQSHEQPQQSHEQPQQSHEQPQQSHEQPQQTRRLPSPNDSLRKWGKNQERRREWAAHQPATHSLPFPADLPGLTREQFQQKTTLFCGPPKWQGTGLELGLQKFQCVTFPITLTDSVQRETVHTTTQKEPNKPFSVLHIADISSKLPSPKELKEQVAFTFSVLNARKTSALIYTPSVWLPLGISTIPNLSPQSIEELAKAHIEALADYAPHTQRSLCYLCLPRKDTLTPQEAQYCDALRREYEQLDAMRSIGIHIIQDSDAPIYAQRLANAQMSSSLIIPSQGVLGGQWFNPLQEHEKTGEERAYCLSSSLTFHGRMINEIAVNNKPLREGMKDLDVRCIQLESTSPNEFVR